MIVIELLGNLINAIYPLRSGLKLNCLAEHGKYPVRGCGNNLEDKKQLFLETGDFIRKL